MSPHLREPSVDMISQIERECNYVFALEYEVMKILFWMKNKSTSDNNMMFLRGGY